MKGWVIAVAVSVGLSAIAGVVFWAANLQRRTDMAEARAVDADGQTKGANAQAGLNANTTNRTGALVLNDRAISEGVTREQERVRLALTPDGGVERAVGAWADGIDRLRDAGGGPAADRVADSDGSGTGGGALCGIRAPGGAGGGHAGRATAAARSRREFRGAARRLHRTLERVPGEGRVDRHAIDVLAGAGRRPAAVRPHASHRRGNPG